MSDIFISYASQDRPKAQVLAQALTQYGWSVWWDRTIPTGKRFDQVIQEALADARCVLVLWSKQSIASDWVLEEAEEGRQRQILVPVFIEDVPPPLGFRRIQAADLTNWDGTGTFPPFQRLVADIAGILGPPGKTEAGQVTSVETKEAGTAVVEREKESAPAPPEVKPPAEPPRPEPPQHPFDLRRSARVLPWLIGGAIVVGVIVAFWVFQGPNRVATVVPPSPRPDPTVPPVEVVIPDPRIESFGAKPQVLIKTDKAILYWKTSNAVAVEISGIGKVPLSGKREVAPEQTTTYILTARNEQGKTRTKTTTIEVPIKEASIPSELIVITDPRRQRILAVDRSTQKVVWDKAVRAQCITAVGPNHLLVLQRDKVERIDARDRVVSTLKGDFGWASRANPSNRKTVIVSYGSKKRVAEMDWSGKVAWSVSGYHHPSEAIRLSDGNTLIADGTSTLKGVSLGGKVIRKLPLAKWAIAVQRLPNGWTVVGESTVIELFDSSWKRINLIGGMGRVGSIQSIDGGEFLVADPDNERVVVLSRTGKIVWTMSGLESPCAAFISGY